MHSINFKHLCLALAVMAIICPLAGAAGERPVAVHKDKPHSLTIFPADAKSATRTFTVVLYNNTDKLRAKGLQGFRLLQPDEAALFAYAQPERVTFWMGTVTFPIDITFVGPDAVIFRVYRHCTPGSRDTYPSGRPARWVIETAAGSGIQVGDRVRIK